MRKTFIFLLLNTLLFSSFSYANQNDFIEVTLAGRVVQLYQPIKIEFADFYEDGGTIGFIIRDNKGTKFAFCLDNRL